MKGRRDSGVSVFGCSAAAVAFLLAVLPGQVRAQGVQALVADLQGRDSAARAAAVQKLQQVGVPAIAPLCHLLYDPQMVYHRAGLLALRQIVWRSTRPGVDSERQAVAAALLAQATSPGRKPEARRAILELTSYVAGPECVRDLAALLDEPAVREMALFILARLPGPEAGHAMAAALRTSDARMRAALIDALAQRRYRPAIPRIRALMQSKDAGVRLAAIEALGTLTDIVSAEHLCRTAEASAARERQAARDACLKLASAALAHGDSRRAVGIYARLGRSAESTAELCATLVGVSHVTDPVYDQAVLTTLANGLKADDPQIRGVAADRLADSKSPAATARLIALTGKGGEEQRASAAGALARRPDEEALNALYGVAQASTASVRLAAIRGILARKDAPAARSVAMLNRRLPAATSDEERRAILAGIELYGDPSSLSGLEAELAAGHSKPEVLSAMLPLADRLASAGRKDDAIGICRQAMTGGGSPRTVRGAARRLRALGVEVDIVSQLGFVPDWWVLGPIPGREEWRTKDAFAIGAVDTSASVPVPGGELRWKKITLDDPTGMIDLNAEVAQRESVAAYAYAEIMCPRDQDAVFRVGSDDDFVCYLNGAKVGQYIGDRAWTADQDSVPVRLAAGWNQIIVKVLNGGGDWAFSLRIVDKNGDPLDLQRSEH